MERQPYGHQRVQADKVAQRRGSVYHGGLLLAAAGGAATVAVYDGLNTSGELIDYFSCVASGYDRHSIEAGIAIREGIYVDVGNYVSSFVLFYQPARE